MNFGFHFLGHCRELSWENLIWELIIFNYLIPTEPPQHCKCKTEWLQCKGGWELMKHLEALPLECIFLNLKIALLNRTMKMLNDNIQIKIKIPFWLLQHLQCCFSQLVLLHCRSHNCKVIWPKKPVEKHVPKSLMMLLRAWWWLWAGRSVPPARLVCEPQLPSSGRAWTSPSFHRWWVYRAAERSWVSSCKALNTLLLSSLPLLLPVQKDIC